MDFVVGVLWVPDGDELAPRLFWRAPWTDLSAFEAATRGSRLPRGQGATGEAWNTREPVGHRSVSEVPPLRRRRAAIEEGLRGVHAIPLLSGEEVVAVVELLSNELTELTERLERSLKGISHEIGQFLARHRAELGGQLLTPREREVLVLASQGLSARASAERLVVSPATITTHLEHIYAKLQVSSKASATAKALRDGLIE
jgi:DNA-binding CsgD family transcriptional regulator